MTVSIGQESAFRKPKTQAVSVEKGGRSRPDFFAAGAGPLRAAARRRVGPLRSLEDKLGGKSWAGKSWDRECQEKSRWQTGPRA